MCRTRFHFVKNIHIISSGSQKSIEPPLMGGLFFSKNRPKINQLNTEDKKRTRRSGSFCIDIHILVWYYQVSVFKKPHFYIVAVAYWLAFLLIKSANYVPQAEKRWRPLVELTLKAGNEQMNPLEVAVVVDSVSGLIKWLFFLVIAIFIIVKYIKEKNADSGTNKHS